MESSECEMNVSRLLEGFYTYNFGWARFYG